MRQKLNFLENVYPVTSGLKPTQHNIKITSYQQLNMDFKLQDPARLAISDGTMNSALYKKILKATVQPSVCDLKLKHTWVIQQDNDPKHTSKSTSEWLKNN